MALLLLVESSTRGPAKNASLGSAARLLLSQVGITSPMSRVVVVLGSHKVYKLSIKDATWGLHALRAVVVRVLQAQLELGC